MEQFDINEFAQMFDAALASNNPSVQKALRNFMIVAAIVHAQQNSENEGVKGPLETLLDKVSKLEETVYDLRRNNYSDYNKTSSDYYKQHWGSYPTWVYSPNTSAISSSSATSNSTLTETDIIDLLKDLKFNE